MADVANLNINGTSYTIKDTVARNAMSGPLVAATKSAMTNTSKVYVYTGSESGMTNGNWYYHNGSAWVSGGVYNSTAIETDKTLTISDKPADAKVTGDRISNLKNDIGRETFQSYSKYYGLINGSGQYIAPGSSNINVQNFKYFPVSTGDNVKIIANASQLSYYALLNSISIPVTHGSYADFAQGHSGRIGIFANDSVQFSVDSGTHYIFIQTTTNSVDITPADIIINGYSLFASLNNLIDIKDEALEKAVISSSPNTKDVTNELVDGYIHFETGKYGTYSGGIYKATDFIEIPKYCYKIKLQCFIPTAGTSGVGFYTSADENSYITGSGSKSISYEYNEIPEGAKYIRFSDYNAQAVHNDVTITFYYGDLLERVGNIEKEVIKTISCWGDSVTEGIGMPDQGTVIYGGDTYESHLYTMLKDAGKDFNVENHGHRYERSIGVISRFKGAYLNQNITIPANNTPVSLGDTYMENGRLIGTCLLNSYLGDSEPVRFFVGAGYDTNPLNIDGIDYTLTSVVVSDGDNHQVVQMRISKTNPDGNQTVINDQTLVLTSSNRKSYINIVYVGINDGNGISLQDWIDRNLQVQESNPNTIVIGCTHNLWRGWQGMTGSTEAQRYKEYLDAAHATFGARFIDLYADLVSQKGMQIAIDAGYLSDRSAAQIAEDNANIANKIVPASLSQNGVANNVHLNSAGYYILAKLIYDRISALGWV